MTRAYVVHVEATMNSDDAVDDDPDDVINAMEVDGSTLQLLLMVAFRV